MTERDTRGRRRALLAAVLAAVMLLFGAPALSAPGPDKQQQDTPDEPVWTGVPGTNVAHDTYGYLWPAAPDCNESDVGSGGCVNDGRGFFQGQCTSWVAHRLSQRNGIGFTNWYDGMHWGNAADWSRVAKQLGYERNQVPAVGAVGWYARGHVSYVEEVNPDGSIVISEMNTDGHNGFHVVTVVPGGTGWPDRFIHLADVVPVDYTPPERPEPIEATHLERGVEVTWRAPADDIGVTGYRVLRNGVSLADTTEPAYVDRQASPGQVYTYTVEARDAAGNVSEPASALLRQTVPVGERRRGPFLSATEVTTATGPVVCGRLGGDRNQRVGCRVRTLEGWRTLRTGREVGWGVRGTRAFVADAVTTTIWYCRELNGSRNACLPLDLTTLSWGYDRVTTTRVVPDHPVWVATSRGPARCGVAGDHARCTLLAPAGWKAPRVAQDARPGDPLSRAFLPTDRGPAFCRTVDGRPTCTTFEVRRMRWTRSVGNGNDVPHGRWVAGPTGPALCPVDGGRCRPVTRPGA